MNRSTNESENHYDSTRIHDNMRNVINNSNTHAPEHTWQSDSSRATTRSVPSEPSSVGTSNPAQSVEFYQQLEKVSRACADAQENSMNIARSCATAQENSLNVTREFSKLMEFFVNSLGQGGDVRTPPNLGTDTASHAGTMSPLMLRPREGVEEPSTHGGGAPVADIKSETKDHSVPERRRESGVPPVTTTSHRIPSGGFHSASETQVATPAFHAGEFPVNRNNYATVDDEPMETSIGHLGQVPDKDFEELRQQLALYDEERAKVKAQMDRIHNPTLGDKLPGAFNNSPIVAFSHTAMVQTTAADPPPDTQRLRNSDLRASGVSKYPDQGIGFNYNGFPVDKAKTPRHIWDRGSALDPPCLIEEVGNRPTSQYTSHGNASRAGSSRTQESLHESEAGEHVGGHAPPGDNGPPGDEGDNDGNGRDDKDCKGKKPSRCHHTPWDDDSSSDESPPSSPPSSPPDSSHSEDSSSSDDKWVGAFAPRNEHLDKKSCRKLRKKTIKKLRAKTEDNECRESWLKGILREYKKQIRHYCNREPVQGTEMPKGVKVPNPARFTGSNDIKEFDTWLLAMLRWIVISQLVGRVNNDQRVQVVGSYLDGDTLCWYNNEVTGLHCYHISKNALGLR
ncbi:hypothetical protein BT96DRAFT_993148 [Gymnopus androsaceus JB14]|uniref:Uncharacterized protein n=1 Tax=Gymnopus androsaceus JB14 TaxID=1447944 RepID=A0A6A4HMV6_9AGAR|nr:hypothetical protein BT96DRAFT_993148 [Gymnopus androsaceus JB14]